MNKEKDVRPLRDFDQSFDCSVPQLTVLSFGGGQDSTALLYLYAYDKRFRARYAPNDFLVVMAATGDEHASTDKHVAETIEFCKKNDIEFVHITPDMGYHGASWQDLRSFYKSKNAVGSKAFPKTCTDRLKIQPIYKFLEDWVSNKYGVEKGRKKAFKEYAKIHGKINMLVGIAAGEEKRVADPSKEPAKWKRESINMVYPLVDLTMDRKACQKFIFNVGHTVPTPSNCILCPFISLQELLWLHRFDKESLNDWIEMEAAKIAANLHMEKRNVGVWGGIKLLPEMVQVAIKKFGDWSDEKLIDYKFSHGHCMSKY